MLFYGSRTLVCHEPSVNDHMENVMSSQDQFSRMAEHIQQNPQMAVLNPYTLLPPPFDGQQQMPSFMQQPAYHPPPPPPPPLSNDFHSLNSYVPSAIDLSLTQMLPLECNEITPSASQQGIILQPPSLPDLDRPVSAAGDPVPSRSIQPDFGTIKELFDRITSTSGLGADYCRMGQMQNIVDTTQRLADEVAVISRTLGFNLTLKDDQCLPDQAPMFSRRDHVVHTTGTLPTEPPRTGRKRAFSAMDLGSMPNGRYPPVFHTLKEDQKVAAGSNLALIKEEPLTRPDLMRQSSRSGPPPSKYSPPLGPPPPDPSLNAGEPTFPPPPPSPREIVDASGSIVEAPGSIFASTFPHPDQTLISLNGNTSWTQPSPPGAAQWSTATEYMDVNMSVTNPASASSSSLSPLGVGMDGLTQQQVSVSVKSEFALQDPLPPMPPSIYSIPAAGLDLSNSPSLNSTTSVKILREHEEEDDYEDDDHDVSSHAAPSPGSDIPAEFRSDVENIFFEYLNSICSNLDATDPKGEKIHQTLMAKKMQRLDGSTDFRPFKFRIQAFTNGFLRELSNRGYPDEKLPVRKVRQYLWRQPHILRFNEDGKKAKSKGNHIWSVEGKKLGECNWEFRPFTRKIAGGPPTPAIPGAPWSWTPHIWDPQALFKGVSVQYSSPSLPPWLSWQNGVLTGTANMDADSADIIVEARFIVDGKEELIVAPIRVGVNTTGHPSAARPGLGSDARTLSDSVLPPVVSTSPISPQLPTSDVIEVLDQSIGNMAAVPSISTSLSTNDKCKIVLSVAREACIEQPEVTSSAMASAVNDVVNLAYNSVCQSQTSGVVRAQPSVFAVSAATNGAVATAVKIKGTFTEPIEIIQTASKVLQQNFKSPNSMGVERPAKRPHSTFSYSFPAPNSFMTAARSSYHPSV
ncbi:hypothetical protein BDV98DRAFT_558055 [Pterulicium gracile]|uniref:Uncharacterized protein n=1 Tax=Pterulicium gracile TaxID=1884261 RepID=A0A5C3R1L8_9AGAR|nr:hypothetical protein BDV98DRAFT_558055 [Pterula gracilis]